LRTDLSAKLIAILEKDQGWDAAYAELPRGDGIIVNIHLADFDLAVKLLCQFVNKRPDRLTRRTPSSPEVNEDRDRGLFDYTLKRIIRHLDDFITSHKILSFIGSRETFNFHNNLPR
jgi:hypothetical protein